MQDNVIPSPSSLRSAVEKTHQDTLMRIAGFVCKFYCRTSCDKGQHARIGRMVKEITFWYGEQVKSIMLDDNSSKGISEGVENPLAVSLIQIDTYCFDGE